jgi:GT2 family glycosyltransferase
MPASQASHLPTSILAVVVLYKREICQSETVSSLFQILTDNPELAKSFSLFLYDNSPQPQTVGVRTVVPTRYVHDPSNGGLASAYNFALATAESEAREWLLLLDQDTSLTREFIFELLEAVNTLRAAPTVGAIVPKLIVNGIMHSPSLTFLTQMRRQFQPNQEPLERDFVGILQQQMCSYNSASTFRVSALRSVGGFPSEFWLDYLDHAVFDALFAGGYQMYVMFAKLAHEASYSDLGNMPSWRLQNVLLAQTLYVKRSGNFIDRLFYRVYLLRHSRNVRRAIKDPRMWRETALQAFLLRVPKRRGSSLARSIDTFLGAPGQEKEENQI